MLKKKKSYLVSFIGFSVMIIVGAILLYLPISNNKDISFKDALYIAISTISCTGLSTVVPIEQFNFFGQFIMAVLMEIGALGFIIFISYIWAKKNKKMRMSDIIMVNDSINGDNYSTIKEHSIFIFNIMIKVQMLGIILLAVKFIPEYGFLKGIWFSIFHTISAFANSGFDLFGSESLIIYNKDLYIQIVLIILMILGSIGIFALEDLKNNKFKNFNKLKLQTKIILLYSIILLIIPTILLKTFDSNISTTNALFMVSSSRSTGMSVINIQDLSNSSKFILTILMFIGGSPASTAGGVRIIAVSVIIATMIDTLRGRINTVIFWKKIPDFIVRKAFTVFVLFMLITIIGIIGYSYFNKEAELVDISLECVSAITNTGFSAVNSSSITLPVEIILMILMYIGRIGPIALVTIFVNDEPIDKLIDYPSENIIL